jgi:polyphenol oxidase
MLTAALLDDIAGIRHGFFTRAGGVSEGVYTSLNCGLGSGDRPDHVLTNRARAMQRFDAEGSALATLYQVHSPTVVEVERPWAPGTAPKADGMVTARPGVALGILTADCAPVLLADRTAAVIGAAHAGWRGALGGVVEATVAAMARLGASPERIAAAVGPCIAQRSYEVGPEFPAPFIADDAANERFFVPAQRAGHFLFDLRGYVGERLHRAGVAQSTALDNDTLSEPAFFSYRRACLNGETDYGRGLSAIMLT